jgi:uncharacterized membrane protein YhiD involved in acid resistance
MEHELQEAWTRLAGSVSVHQSGLALTVAIQLLFAGALGLYVRMLFCRTSTSASDTESISRAFPLLTVITAGVIGVVKSSLALSLGFLGALSIVRFRAAIKEPEELVYLFLSVAIGLAIGAEVPLLALLLTVAATVLAVVLRFQYGKSARHSLLLTVTGDSDDESLHGTSGIFATLTELLGPHTLQRVDMEDGRAQIRLILPRTDARRTTQIIGQLKQRLPGCDFSYVNLDSSL